MPQAEAAEAEASPEKSGWLLKWTNYMKGYRKRWFVLQHGVLSYYVDDADAAASCRGSLVVHDAVITVDAGNNFALSVPKAGSSATARMFHLRAFSEEDHVSWINAIEAAKVQSTSTSGFHFPTLSSHGGRKSLVFSPSGRNTVDIVDELESASEGDMSDDELTGDAVVDSVLGSKIKKMQTWQLQLKERCTRFHDQLEEGRREIPGVGELQDEAAEVERTAADLLEACRTYVEQLSTHQKDWTNMLRTNNSRTRELQAQLETLAREHQSLVGNAASPGRSRTRSQSNGDASTPRIGEVDSDDDIFFDAVEADAPGIVADTESCTKASLSGESTATKALGDEMKTAGAGPAVAIVTRRTRIPASPKLQLSLWSMIKSCVGKDLSRIAMPVNFNEPISFTQRLCEDLEYSDLLTRAANSKTPAERMVWVSAFTASGFASQAKSRTGKPFNPLLGETYELDRRAEQGWRAIAEQVSHHPPICCMHAESDTWVYWQECAFTMQFWGQYIDVKPTGLSHLIFKDTGDHFTWTKVSTKVHNIIVGSLWVDQHGTMIITNHRTGDTCSMEYVPYAMFSASDARTVKGKVCDKAGKTYYKISGKWDKGLVAEPVGMAGSKFSVWHAVPPPPYTESMYHMSLMALTLNEMTAPDEGCAPTDARLRPDVRAMENGNWEQANSVKVALEEAQRARRRDMERRRDTWRPRWFDLKPDPCYPNRQIHQFNDKYWETKETKSWEQPFDMYAVKAK